MQVQQEMRHAFARGPCTHHGKPVHQGHLVQPGNRGEQRRDTRGLVIDRGHMGVRKRADRSAGQHHHVMGIARQPQTGQADDLTRQVDAQHLATVVGQRAPRHGPAFLQHEQFLGRGAGCDDQRTLGHRGLVVLHPGDETEFIIVQLGIPLQPAGKAAGRPRRRTRGARGCRSVSLMEWLIHYVFLSSTGLRRRSACWRDQHARQAASSARARCPDVRVGT